MRKAVNNFTKELHTPIGVLLMTVHSVNDILVTDRSRFDRNTPANITINGVSFSSLSIALKHGENGWYTEYISLNRNDWWKEASASARKKAEQTAMDAVRQWETYYTHEVREAHSILAHNSLARKYSELQAKKDSIAKLQAEADELTAEIEVAEPITANMEREQETAAV